MKYPIFFALLVALCWGLYGPTLAQSRSALHSPFKPYVAIGFAYLVWAIGGGLVGMWYKGDPISFSGAGGFSGFAWGFAAGTLGAFGAFNLTLAMFSGGGAMPHVVMPIVFGGAITVASISTLVLNKGIKASPWFWVGVVGIFISVCLVGYNTPDRLAHKPPGGDHAEEGAE